MVQRDLKVFLETLPAEQLDDVGKQLGIKIGNTMARAAAECNQLLNNYGLRISINYKLIPDTVEPTSLPEKSKNKKLKNRQ